MLNVTFELSAYNEPGEHTSGGRGRGGGRSI